MPEHHCRHCCTHKKSPRSYKIHRSPRSPRSPRSRRSPRSYKLHRSPRSRRYRQPDTCPICLEPANDDDGPLSARCDNENKNYPMHYFHEDCLDNWVRMHPPGTNRCPECRSPNCRNLANLAPPLPPLPAPLPPLAAHLPPNGPLPPPEPIPPPVIGAPPGPWDPVPLHRQIAVEMPCFTCFRTTGNDCGRCRTCHAVYGPPQNAQTAVGNNVVCDGHERTN